MNNAMKGMAKSYTTCQLFCQSQYKSAILKGFLASSSSYSHHYAHIDYLIRNFLKLRLEFLESQLQENGCQNHQSRILVFAKELHVYACVYVTSTTHIGQ